MGVTCPKVKRSEWKILKRGNGTLRAAGLHRLLSATGEVDDGKAVTNCARRTEDVEWHHHRFEDGRESLENDLRNGRPFTS